MSDSVRPHRRQPTRLPRPWDSPGKNTGVGCHFLLQYIKVKVKWLNHVRLLATPWTVAHQAPLSMGFSRQEPLKESLAVTNPLFCPVLTTLFLFPYTYKKSFNFRELLRIPFYLLEMLGNSRIIE